LQQVQGPLQNRKASSNYFQSTQEKSTNLHITVTTIYSQSTQYNHAKQHKIKSKNQASHVIFKMFLNYSSQNN